LVLINGPLVFYLLMKLLSKRKHSKLIIMQELTSQDILVPSHLCMRFLLTMKITMTTMRTSMSLGQFASHQLCFCSSLLLSCIVINYQIVTLATVASQIVLCTLNVEQQVACQIKKETIQLRTHPLWLP